MHKHIQHNDMTIASTEVEKKQIPFIRDTKKLDKKTNLGGGCDRYIKGAIINHSYQFDIEVQSIHLRIRKNSVECIFRFCKEDGRQLCTYNIEKQNVDIKYVAINIML